MGTGVQSCPQRVVVGKHLHLATNLSAARWRSLWYLTNSVYFWKSLIPLFNGARGLLTCWTTSFGKECFQLAEKAVNLKRNKIYIEINYLKIMKYYWNYSFLEKLFTDNNHTTREELKQCLTYKFKWDIKLITLVVGRDYYVHDPDFFPSCTRVNKATLSVGTIQNFSFR